MCRKTGQFEGVIHGHPHVDGFSYRRQNVFFMITSPTPGTFVIALHFKGRDKPIVEMDFKIDDLLEKASLSFCSGPGTR